MNYNLISVLGPTAVGKTKFSVKLANHFNGEIISADSRQVYKKMDLGTGKDLNDYLINGMKIKYHLIDIIEPAQEFNLFLFKKKFYEAYSEIIQRKKIPFLVGGTGLYLSAVIQNYHLADANFNSEKYNEYSSLSHSELKKILLRLNPVLHNTTDLLDKERTIRAIIIEESKQSVKSNLPEIKINSFNIGIKMDRAELKNQITERLKQRFKNGMIEEVKNLISMGITFEKLSFFGLEYKYIGLYLMNKLSYNDMFQKLNSAIHSFAKRQMTWFRKMEKEGVKINWLENHQHDEAVKLINENYFK